MLEAGISRDEYLVARAFCGIEELAIRQLGPAALVGRCDLMRREWSSQGVRRALIEEHAHSNGDRGASGGMIEDGPDLLAGHAGKPLGELRYGCAVLEVLE